MFWWEAFKVDEACFMALKISTFVVALSTASIWNSIVVKTPSNCRSWVSNRLFLASACKATRNWCYDFNGSNIHQIHIYIFNVCSMNDMDQEQKLDNNTCVYGCVVMSNYNEPLESDEMNSFSISIFCIWYWWEVIQHIYEWINPNTVDNLLTI